MSPKPFKPLDSFLVIALLGSLAFAQPLFNLLGNQAEFLVAHRLSGIPLAAFALALGLVVPAVLALIPVLGAKISSRFGRILFNSLVFILFVLITLPVLVRSDFDGELAAGIALLFSALILWLYLSFDAIRLFFKYLVPAILVFPLLFLFASRASPLLFESQTGADSAKVSLGSTPDIIFLVLDEFPLVSLLNSGLQIDRKAYPNFARLADMANWYRGATTGAEVTVDAVPEALTGLEPHPDGDRLPISSNYPNNLFTLLQNRYSFNVHETATRLCPREACLSKTSENADRLNWSNLFQDLQLVYAHLVLLRPWSFDLPTVSNGWSGFGREPTEGQFDSSGLETAQAKADLAKQSNWRTRSEDFLEFIESIENLQEPQLYYLHTLLPHATWRYLPDGQQYLVDEAWVGISEPGENQGRYKSKIYGSVWQDDPLAVQIAQKRHIWQVRYVDKLLGQLLDHLESQAMLDGSLLILMGDHGTSFIPGQPRRSMTTRTLSDVSAIPLLIKLPGQNVGEIISSPASLVDLLPTIADVLSAKTDWKFDGSSLLQIKPGSNGNVVVMNAVGKAFSYSFEEHMKHLAMRASENAHLTNPAPYTELIGKNPTDLDIRDTSQEKVSLRSALLYLDVQLDSGFIPYHVAGEIEGRANQANPVTLAIAVNGVIRAITRTYQIPRYENYFEALLPIGTFEQGQNDIDLFMIGSEEGHTYLAPLNQEQSATHTLANGDDHEIVLDNEGHEFKVQSGRIIGRSSTIAKEGTEIIVLKGELPGNLNESARVAAFTNGQFAGISKITDKAFNLSIRRPPLQRFSETQLRVFVLNGQSAVELNYPRPCSVHWHFAPPASWGDAICEVTAVSPLMLEGGSYVGSLDMTDISVRQYLESGWVVEPDNVSWTVTQEAIMEIPIPALENALHFTARIRPFLSPPILSAQEIYLLANDEPVASWTLDEKRSWTINWSLTPAVLAKRPGSVRLSFLLPDAVSPESIGASGDRRLLGISFTKIDMESGSQGAPDTAQ